MTFHGSVFIDNSCTGYTGGSAKVASDMQESLNIGLSCMNKIGGKALRISDTRDPQYINLYARIQHRYGVVDRYTYGTTMTSMEEVNSELNGAARANPDLSLVTEMGLGMFHTPAEGETRESEARDGGGFDYGPFMGLALASATVNYGPEELKNERKERLENLIRGYYPGLENRRERKAMEFIAEIFKNAVNGDVSAIRRLKEKPTFLLRNFCEDAAGPPLDGQLARVKDGLGRILSSLGKSAESRELNSTLCSSVEPKNVDKR